MVVNFFVKALGHPESIEWFNNLQSYPAHELVLARSVVSFAISLYIVKKRELPFLGNNKLWLTIRGVAGTIALTIFFYTLHYLPLAVASTVQYLAPIFTILLAILLLKERVKLLQWIFIGISFSGVVLIGMDEFLSQGDQHASISPFWFGMGMLSSAFSGLAYVAIMKLRDTDAPITIVMYFPMIAGPIMILLCFISFTIPSGIEWLFLLIIGVFTQIAQILLTKALHSGNASTITPFQYLGAIYAFIIGLVVFEERLSFWVNIGIILTVAGVVINVILRRKTR